MAGRSPEGPYGIAIREAFGHVVRRAREDVGLSQEELAERCEKHRTYVSLIERGRSSPTLGTLFALARALELRPDELIARCARAMPRRAR